MSEPPSKRHLKRLLADESLQPEELQQTSSVGARQEQEARDFESVEQMLQFDARQVPMPEGVEERLRESIGEPRVERAPWWRRLLTALARRPQRP